jgi:hypothetical protein
MIKPSPGILFALLFLTTLAEAEIDVDYSTGQLSFSEPLVNVKGRQLSYTVKLRYSSDIKRGHAKSEAGQITPELAGWAGLGFDVDVPYIERTIVGPPDPAEGNTYDALGHKASVWNPFYGGTHRVYWNCYNYSPLVYRTSEGYGTNFHEQSHAYDEDGLPIWETEGVLNYPKFLCEPGDAYVRDGHLCDWCPELDMQTRGYLTSDQINQQTQQDRYDLRNFPAGDGRLYFTMAQTSEGKLLANVAPYRPWRVDYVIEEPAKGETNTEIYEWHITDDNGTTYIFGGTTNGGVDARVWLDGTDTWGTIYRTAEIAQNLEMPQGDIQSDFGKLAFAAVEKFNAGPVVERWYLREIISYDRTESVRFDYRAITDPVVIEEKPYVRDIVKWKELTPPYIEYSAGVGRAPYYNELAGGSTDPQDLRDGAGLCYKCDKYEFTVRPYMEMAPETHYLSIAAPYGTDPQYPVGRYSFSTPVKVMNTKLLIDGFKGEYKHGKAQCKDEMTRATGFVCDDGYSTRILGGIELPYGRGIEIQESGSCNKWVRNPLNGDLRCVEPLGCIELKRVEYNVEDKVVQAVVTDESRRYGQTLVPLSITSARQKVVFDEQVSGDGARTDQDPLGRGRLRRIVLYDISSPDGSQVEQKRITFEHANPSGSFCGRLQLKDVYVNMMAGRPGSQRRRLYHFGYREKEKKADDFGRVNIGMLDTVIDVDGGKTLPEYEKGTYSRLSNNTNVPADSCGWRVARLTRRAGFQTPDVTESITYTQGEMNYGTGLKYDDSDGFWDGMVDAVTRLKKAFNDAEGYASNELGLNVSYDYEFALDRYDVHYGMVRIQLEGTELKNWKIYEYLQSDDAGLSDGENEYNPNALYRYRLKKLGYYGHGAPGALKQVTYHYEVPDVVAEYAQDFDITEDEARKRLEYTKPMTRMDQFQINCCERDERRDFCTDRLGFFRPEHAYQITAMRGMAQKTMVRASAVRVTKVETTVSGLKTTTEYEYNTKGYVSAVKRSGPSHPGVELIEKRTYGYELERELNPAIDPSLPQPILTPAPFLCELEGELTEEQIEKQIKETACDCRKRSFLEQDPADVGVIDRNEYVCDADRVVCTETAMNSGKYNCRRVVTYSNCNLSGEVSQQEIDDSNCPYRAFSDDENLRTYVLDGGATICKETAVGSGAYNCYRPVTWDPSSGITDENIPENSFFLRYNVLSPVVLTQTLEMRTDWETPKTLAASFSLWQRAEEEAPAYPAKAYVWAVEHGEDGYPVSPFTLDTRLEPLKEQPSDEWLLQSEITKRDGFTRPLEQRSAGGTQLGSTIYRHDLNAVQATVSAGAYDECAAYTCDYHLGQGSGSLDSWNQWGRGGAHDASGVVEVTTARPHFGTKSVHVKNAWGPSRNVDFSRGTDYEFWAWVYPTAAAGRMTVEFRTAVGPKRPTALETYGGAWTKSLADLPLNQWSPVRLTIKADQIPQRLREGVDITEIEYMRIWVGNGPGESACDFYMDDLRFHPSSALMSTNYYYERSDYWSLPRVSVGPDGNPGVLTEYDEFGMPCKTYQFSHDGAHLILGEKEYYVQGDNAE